MAFDNINFGLLVALLALASVFIFGVCLLLLNTQCCYRFQCKWRSQTASSVHVEPIPDMSRPASAPVAFDRSAGKDAKAISRTQSILDYEIVEDKILVPSSSSTLLKEHGRRRSVTKFVPRAPPIPMDLSSIKNVSIQIHPDEVYGSSDNRSDELYETTCNIPTLGKRADPHHHFQSTEADDNSDSSTPRFNEINGSHKYPVDHALEDIILEGQMFTVFQADTPHRVGAPSDDVLITELNDSFLDGESVIDVDQTLASSLMWDSFMPTPYYLMRSPCNDATLTTDLTLDKKSTLF